MSIQNELTKLYKKLSEEGLNKEAQRLTPFIKESQFFTFLRPQHNQALRKINRAIRAGQTGVAEAQLNNLKDLITDEQLMADLKKNLDQGDASGRRKFMRMLKAILKVLKAGGNVTLQNVKQEVETEAPVEEVKKETPKQEETEKELPQTPEADIETEDSKEIKTTTELKALPTSEEGAIGDKKYKYFYNAAKKGFQVAKGSRTSEGAIIKAKNTVPGVQKEYNDKLDEAYAIIYDMFKRQGYNINEIPSPQAEAKYTGPASDVKYEKWKPESVGFTSSGFDPKKDVEEINGVKYYMFSASGDGNVDYSNFPNYESGSTKQLLFVKVDDYNNSQKKKITEFFAGENTDGSKGTDKLTKLKVVTPDPAKPNEIKWEKA